MRSTAQRTKPPTSASEAPAVPKIAPKLAVSATILYSTAGGRMNESPSVRGTAASEPEPRQPSTSDPRHDDNHEVEETQQEEEEEERDNVVDIVRG